MVPRHKMLTAPKKQEADTTNMDYAQADDQNFRSAISDGVATAIRSGVWARQLVESFLQQQPALDEKPLLGWIDSLRPEYNKGLMNWAQGQLIYHRILAERSGSQATFMGITYTPLNKADRGQWHACAVGDCNLIQYRNGERIVLWPWDDPKEFGRTPQIICSFRHLGPDEASENWCDFHTGEYQAGDIFVMATDALSAWFLDHPEFDLATFMDDGFDQEKFRIWVDEQRHPTGNLKDDDTTLLLLHMSSPPAMAVAPEQSDAVHSVVAATPIPLGNKSNPLPNETPNEVAQAVPILGASNREPSSAPHETEDAEVGTDSANTGAQYTEKESLLRIDSQISSFERNQVGIEERVFNFERYQQRVENQIAILERHQQRAENQIASLERNQLSIEEQISSLDRKRKIVVGTALASLLVSILSLGSVVPAVRSLSQEHQQQAPHPPAPPKSAKTETSHAKPTSSSRKKPGQKQ